MPTGPRIVERLSAPPLSAACCDTSVFAGSRRHTFYRPATSGT